MLPRFKISFLIFFFSTKGCQLICAATVKAICVLGGEEANTPMLYIGVPQLDRPLPFNFRRRSINSLSLSFALLDFVICQSLDCLTFKVNIII